MINKLEMTHKNRCSMSHYSNISYLLFHTMYVQ